MSDEASFLAAIRDAPADDTARLVFADWLQEHGQEQWAQLIRVQVELARPAPEQPSSLKIDLFSSEEYIRRVHEYRAAAQRRPQLDRLEAQLLAGLQLPVPAGWSVAIGLGLVARGRGALLLRRGLPERAVCTGSVWVADGDAVLARYPVERVRLTGPPRLLNYPDGIELDGDPLQKRFPYDAVRAVWRENDPPRETVAGALVPLLRLRFGERPAFE